MPIANWALVNFELLLSQNGAEIYYCPIKSLERRTKFINIKFIRTSFLPASTGRTTTGQQIGANKQKPRA